MNDEQMDVIFERAPEIPTALVEKIRAGIQKDTQPAKPMLSSSVYALLFVVLFILVSLAFATILQFKGLHALSAAAATELLLTLLTAAVFGADTIARSMRPAAGRLQVGLISGSVLIAYEFLISRLLDNYGTSGAFIHSGVMCLSFGVLCGAVVAAPLWLIVGRGLVVQPVLAGAAIGLVGGLSGLTFLTLHCPILTVPHTSIWHAAVILVCVTAGAVAGRLK